MPALVGERRPIERRPLDGGPFVRLLGPDCRDPHAAILDRFRELARQRRPWLVGSPPMVTQQSSERRTETDLDGRAAPWQDTVLGLAHVGEHLCGQLLVVLSVWRDRQA